MRSSGIAAILFIVLSAVFAANAQGTTLTLTGQSTATMAATTSTIGSDVLAESYESTTPSLSSGPDDQPNKLISATPADEPTSVTTSEGVVYQVLKPGNGAEEQSTNTLLLHYTLFLTDGSKLESSRDAEFPVPLHLKRGEGGFIQGFEIGTEGMRIGEVRRILVPAELGYGEKGTATVPPDSTLIFEVELVDLK